VIRRQFCTRFTTNVQTWTEQVSWNYEEIKERLLTQRIRHLGWEHPRSLEGFTHSGLSCLSFAAASRGAHQKQYAMFWLCKQNRKHTTVNIESKPFGYSATQEVCEALVSSSNLLWFDMPSLLRLCTAVLPARYLCIWIAEAYLAAQLLSLERDIFFSWLNRRDLFHQTDLCTLALEIRSVSCVHRDAICVITQNR